MSPLDQRTDGPVRARRVLIVALALAGAAWGAAPADIWAQAPPAEDEGESGVPALRPTHLRQQGLHYLRVGRREAARQTLERALKLGGADDERLILALAKLYVGDGDLARAYEVLAEGPRSDKVQRMRAELGTLYCPVRLEPAIDGPSGGPVALTPSAPIINPDKKAQFARAVARHLQGDVQLPLDIYLPSGHYRVNGRPFDITGEGLVRVPVPMFDVVVILSPARAAWVGEINRRLRSEIGARVRLVDLSHPDTAVHQMTRAAAREPHLVLALGSEAVRRAYRDLVGVPLLAVGLERRQGERLLKRHGAATAVWRDLPRGRLLEQAARTLPAVRRVGVLFEPGRSWSAYQEALDQRPPELTLVPISVTGPKSVAFNLLRALPQIDALWVPRNPDLFDAGALLTLGIFAHREKLPLLVEELQRVEQGALLAAEVTDRDLVEEALQQCRRVLWEDRSPQDVPATYAGRLSWGINTAIARALGATFPPDVIDQARKRVDVIPAKR